MIPTPVWLAEFLGRRTPPAEPKPDPAPAVPEPVPAQTIRVSPPIETRLPRTWVNAELSETEVHREALVLDQLADLTHQHGPREAAMKLFGGRS